MEEPVRITINPEQDLSLIALMAVATDFDSQDPELFYPEDGAFDLTIDHDKDTGRYWIEGYEREE